MCFILLHCTLIQLSKYFIDLCHFGGLLLGIRVGGYTDELTTPAQRNLGDEIESQVWTLS